jgi:hypothetical protein
VAVIGQLEAAGMSQHVRMDGKRQLGGLTEPYHEMMEAHRAVVPPRSHRLLRDSHVVAQSADLVTTNGIEKKGKKKVISIRFFFFLFSNGSGGKPPGGCRGRAVRRFDSSRLLIGTQIPALER